jgi:hypothetical protein
MLDDAVILVPLFWPAPHSCMTIRVVQTKPVLVSEQHGGLVSNSPVDMIFDPGQSLSSVFLLKWNTNAGFSGAKIGVKESVSDYLVGFHGIQEVQTEGINRSEPILLGLKSKKLVL